MGAQGLANELQSLKKARKEGDISLKDFYKSLLHLLAELTEELEEEQINDSDIKKQIPLILAFLEDQISNYKERGG